MSNHPFFFFNPVYYDPVESTPSVTNQNGEFDSAVIYNGQQCAIIKSIQINDILFF